MKQKRKQNKQVFFRKWQNKKYSVFNSLGRSIKICPLALTYTLVIAPMQVKGENDSITTHYPEYDLEEVTVAGSRSPLQEDELARIINIIPAAEIESSPSQCVSDYLDYLPGVDIRTRGPLGIQSDIGVRGGTFEQTTILLNGVKVTDPQTGHNSMNLPIDLNNINRIEFIKGSASRVFGASAFSGAVNIVCRPQFSDFITGNITGGSNGYYNFSILANTDIKNTRHLFSIGHSASDGYIYNTDFKIYNIYYNAIADLKTGKLSFQTGYQDKAAGAQNFYSRTFPTQFEKMRTGFASVSFETNGLVKWKPMVYFRRGHDRFELYREGADFYTWENSFYINHNKGDTARSFYRGHNYHMNTALGFENNISYTTTLGTSTLGLDIRSENILSNTIGILTDTVKAPGEDNGYFFRERNRLYTGIFAEHKINMGKVYFNGGILVQHSSDYDWQVYPGLDIKYNITKKINVFANINRATRLPSFTELYYNTSTHASDPNLKPENSVSAETGFFLKNNSFSGYISLFYIDGRNLIDWVMDTNIVVDENSGVRKWESRNITSSTTVGTEILFDLNLSNLLSENFIFKNFQVSYTYLNKELSSGQYLSAYTLDYMKNKVNLNLFSSYKKFYLNINVSIQDRNDYFDWISRSEIITDPFLLVDSRIYYQTEKLKFYLNVNNIFNTLYFDYIGIEMPGRFINIGVSRRFIL